MIRTLPGTLMKSVIESSPIIRSHSFSGLIDKKIPERKKKRRNSSISKDVEPVIKAKPKKAKKSTKKAKIVIKKSNDLQFVENMLHLVTTYPNYVRNISDFVFSCKIGQGGGGEVWLANDLRSGKVCAVKELYSELLDSAQLSNFIREIITMAKSKSRFCIPLVGFTIEKPFSIITEYMPNGDLHSMILKEKNNTIFSGTHLTMIAIGVIHAIRHIHSNHIIHRDVKCANVLLDHRYLPKLGDFGISRIIAKNRPMTEGIGTPSHMAPELMKSQYYSETVDIYAFGMMLYEMVEKRVPFRYLSAEEICHAVTLENLRPGFKKKNTPKPLVDLIRSCWSKEEPKRPKSQEIFDLFAKGIVYFAGSDSKQIEKFIHILNNEKMSDSFYSPPPIYAKVYSIKKVLRKKEKDLQERDADRLSKGLPLNPEGNNDSTPEYFSKQNDITDVWKSPSEEEISLNFSHYNDDYYTMIISNPSHLDFVKTLEELCAKITITGFPSMLAILTKSFKECQDEYIQSVIIDQFVFLMKKDIKFVQKIVKSRIVSLFPTDSRLCIGSITSFISFICESAPQFISALFFRSFGAIINNDPFKALCILSNACREFLMISDRDSFSIFLLSYARVFGKIPAGAVYIRMIFFLCTNYHDFYEMFSDKIHHILIAYSSSPCIETALASINALISLMNNEYQIPFGILIQRLNEPKLCGSIISIFLLSSHYPVSNTFAKSLINKSLIYPRSIKVLLRFAHQQKETALIVANNLKWMQVFTEDSFHLFLYIFSFPEFRKQLIGSDYFCRFVYEVFHTMGDRVLVSLSIVFRRSALTQTIVDDLSNIGFVLDIIRVFDEPQNINGIHNCLLIVEALARAGFCTDYLKYVKFLSSFLSPPSKLTNTAIEILVVFSSHSYIAKKFKDSSLMRYFEKLKNLPSFSNMANIFINNVNNS